MWGMFEKCGTGPLRSRGRRNVKDKGQGEEEVQPGTAGVGDRRGEVQVL